MSFEDVSHARDHLRRLDDSADRPRFKATKRQQAEHGDLVDLTNEQSSDESNEHRHSHRRSSRKHDSRQQEARQEGSSSSSGSVRVASKLTYRDSRMSAGDTRRFPGTGHSLSRPGGTVILPTDPESKRDRHQHATPSSSTTNSNRFERFAAPSASSTIKGGYKPGWNNNFNNNATSSSSSKASRTTAPVHPSFQHLPPSGNSGNSRSSAKPSIVSGLSVKGAKKTQTQRKEPEVISVDDDDEQEAENEERAVSFEEQGRAGASNARDKARAKKGTPSLFSHAVSAAQNQDNAKERQRQSAAKRTDANAHFDLDDEIENPDASQPRRSSKRPRSSDGLDPLDGLAHPSRAKPPRASSRLESASEIARANSSTSSRVGKRTGQATLDDGFSMMNGTSGTDDFGNRKRTLWGSITECEVDMPCLNGFQFFGTPFQHGPIRAVFNLQHAHRHIITFFSSCRAKQANSPEDSMFTLELRRDFDRLTLPDNLSDAPFVCFALTGSGYDRIKTTSKFTHQISKDGNSLGHALPGGHQLFVKFVKAADAEAFAACAPRWKETSNIKIGRISGSGGSRTILHEYDTAKVQLISQLEASASSAQNRRTAPRIYGAASSRQGTLRDSINRIPSCNLKASSSRRTLLKDGSPDDAAADNEDIDFFTSTRRSSRRRREARRSKTPEEPDPIPADTLILVWPLEGGPGSVYIHHGDRKRLADGEFLNDTLIDYGLKRILMTVQERDAAFVDKVHLFNSFFYKKLSAPKSRKDPKADPYSTVRKWTTKSKLFEKDYIIVPINENLHWYLAIIVNPRAILQPPLPPGDVPARNTRRGTRESNPTTPSGETKSHFFPPALTGDLNSPKADDDVVMSNGENIEDNEIVLSSTGGDIGQEREDASTSSAASEEVTRQLIPPGKEDVIASSPQPDEDGEVHAVNETPPVSIDPADEREQINLLTSGDFEEGAMPDASPRSRCYILTFDSLGGSHSAVHKKLRAYLGSEAADKLGMSADQLSLDDAVGVAVDVPVQENYSDCGLYLLHFVETFLANPQGLLQAALLPKKKGEKDSDRRARIAQLWSDDAARQRRRIMREEVQHLSAAWAEHQAKEVTTATQSGDSDKPKKKRPRASAPANLENVPGPAIESDAEASKDANASKSKRGRGKKVMAPQSITIDDSEDEYTTDDGDSDDLPELARLSSQNANAAHILGDPDPASELTRPVRTADEAGQGTERGDDHSVVEID